MERRAVLRSLAAATAATGGAGCIDAVADDGSADGDGGEASPSMAGTTFTVTDTGCGAAASEATVAEDGDAVVVEGRIPASGDATTAELLGASYDAAADRLRVAVGTASRGEGGGGCPTVVGYRATVAFDGGRPGATAVYHDGVRVGGVDAGGRVTDASFAVEEVAAGEEGGASRDAATPTIGGRRLIVEGEIAASDGCATAVLDGAAVADAGDAVTVDVVTMPRTGGPCAEGGARIAYRALLRFVGDVPRTVTVRHDGDRIAGLTLAEAGEGTADAGGGDGVDSEVGGGGDAESDGGGNGNGGATEGAVAGDGAGGNGSGGAG